MYLLSQSWKGGNDVLTYSEKAAWGKKWLRTTGLETNMPDFLTASDACSKVVKCYSTG